MVVKLLVYLNRRVFVIVQIVNELFYACFVVLLFTNCLAMFVVLLFVLLASGAFNGSLVKTMNLRFAYSRAALCHIML